MVCASLRNVHGKARLLLLLVLLLAAAIAAMGLLRAQPDPIYGGHSLASWVDSFNGDRESKKAITEIVNNCLPSLVRQLQYDPFPRRARIAAIAKFLPKALLTNRRISSFISIDPRERRAFTACNALIIAGPAASAAVPDLKRLATSTNWPACTLAIQVLIRIDHDPAPTLAAVVLNPQHPARHGALESGADSPTITPGLIQLLVPAVTNSNEQIACVAIGAVGELAHRNGNLPIHVFIQESDLLVPTLLRATRDPRTQVSQIAKDSLRLLTIQNKEHLQDGQRPH